MPCIRWMGCYGQYREKISLKWELTQKQQEVSAEWTIRNRPFILVGVGLGLLVKSNAVLKRTRCDVHSSLDRGIKKWKRTSKLNPELFNSHAWEAICYPQYAGIVVTEGVKDVFLQDAIESCQEFKIPLLMLQAGKILRPV